jgi:oligopeptide transport system permease protein
MKLTKGRVGRALLILLAAVSLLYPLLARIPGLPACPFGADPGFNTETICSRTFGGLWRSVVIGLGAGAASCGLALGLALLARRFRGLTDTAVAKLADLVFAVPDVLVLIAIGFAVNVVNGEGGVRTPALVVMIVSLTAVGWAAPTRQIQNRLRSLESQEFVLAAEAVGASRWRIVRRHLLPFAREFVLAIFLLRIPAIILTESTVSFLGFGLPIDEPSLGAFIGTNYDKLMYGGQAHVVLPAWGLLLVVVLAFQWTGQDVLRRATEKAS